MDARYTESARQVGSLLYDILEKDRDHAPDFATNRLAPYGDSSHSQWPTQEKQYGSPARSAALRRSHSGARPARGPQSLERFSSHHPRRSENTRTHRRRGAVPCCAPPFPELQASCAKILSRSSVACLPHPGSDLPSKQGLEEAPGRCARAVDAIAPSLRKPLNLLLNVVGKILDRRFNLSIEAVGARNRPGRGVGR